MQNAELWSRFAAIGFSSIVFSIQKNLKYGHFQRINKIQPLSLRTIAHDGVAIRFLLLYLPLWVCTLRGRVRARGARRADEVSR